MSVAEKVVRAEWSPAGLGGFGVQMKWEGSLVEKNCSERAGASSAAQWVSTSGQSSANV